MVKEKVVREDDKAYFLPNPFEALGAVVSFPYDFVGYIGKIPQYSRKLANKIVQTFKGLEADIFNLD